MDEQQEKLWGVFATYALQLSSEDPARLRAAHVPKLLQDCGVIDGADTEQAKLVETEVAIVCEAFLRSSCSGERDGARKLTFPAFLALLRHLAKLSGDPDPNRAYDALVCTCIERQAKPRARVTLTREMEECKKVLAAFDDPLTKIFAFYASATLAKLEKLEPKVAQLSPPHMGYAESVAFGRTYGIIALGMLTTTEFSAVYIDTLAKNPATEYDRVLTYENFCELLVRLSHKVVVAPSASSSEDDSGETIPSDKRLKGLFQLMWLACASNSPRALKLTDVLKSDRMDVVKLFLLHFEKFWKKEHYENYVGWRGGGPSTSELDDGPSRWSSMNPLTSSSSPSRPSLARTLSLCVQTTSSSTAAAAAVAGKTEDGAKSPGVRRSPLQRRFTVSSPMSSPSTSPAKLKQPFTSPRQRTSPPGTRTDSPPPPAPTSPSTTLADVVVNK